MLRTLSESEVPNRGCSIHRDYSIFLRWKKAWFVPEIYDIPHQGHKSIRKASKQGHMFIFTVGGGQGGKLLLRRPMGGVCTCLMATVNQAVTISILQMLRNNGWYFITCNYDPPGNYIGQHPYDDPPGIPESLTLNFGVSDLITKPNMQAQLCSIAGISW